MSADDLLHDIFAEETNPAPQDEAPMSTWKIMIVDDEPAVHDVTMVALGGTLFLEKRLEFIHAYSGKEAKELITQHTDTAVVLLDVVMETEHAGLDVVRYIREEIHNQQVRIVLRTGQPGQAPERKVVTDYDINDYKEKTELTASKLFTLMHASLRGYRDILTIEQSKRGLAQIIDTSTDLFRLSAIDGFAAGVLEQLCALLGANPGALYLGTHGKLSGFAAELDSQGWVAIAGTGSYQNLIGQSVESLLNERHCEILKESQREKRNILRDGMFVSYFASRTGKQNLLLIDGVDKLNKLGCDLVELFTKNVSIAFENVHLHKEIEETQQEVVYLLGEAVEQRSKETGNHVKRVAEISKSLALWCGLTHEQAEILKAASPLHDLGKIAIPDDILNKPGRHTPEEQVIMRSHAEIGYQMLCHSPRPVLKAAATVALEHHERWDGDGYPNKKAGEDIHIYGRITAVADVFDALGSDRCYKKAWPLEEIVAFFQDQKGKQFDPSLVDILLQNINEVAAIRESLPD